VRRAPGRWIPFLPAVVAALLYLPSLDNAFVNWDDDKNLTANPFFRGLGWPQLHWMWTTHLMGHYIPVTWMSFGLDFTLWDMDPFGYHLTNLILHAVNASLFFLVARELLRRVGADNSSQWGALFAAMVFAVHPLRVESVAWITERRDVLSGVFWLLSLLAYLRRRIAASLAAFILALLSKEIALTLPALFVLLDWLLLQRIAWLEKLPFAILSVASAIVTWRIGVAEGNAASFSGVTLWDRFAISIYGLAFYVRKTLAPVGLSPFYELTRSKIDPLGRSFLLSAALVITMTAAALIWRRRQPGLLAAWLAYACILSPVVGVTQNGRQIAADRYSYLACLGFAVLAGAAFVWAWKRYPAPTAAAAAILVATLCFLTTRQIRVWTDSEALWRRANQVEPSATAFKNLGVALAERGDTAAAIDNYRRSITLDPNDPETTADLAAALLDSHQWSDAEDHFRQSLTTRPDFPNSHYGLALALEQQGRRDEARRELEQALRLRPDYPAASAELQKLR